MSEAGEAESRPHGLAEADADVWPRDEREDEPGLSSLRSFPFTTVSEVSFRSSSLSAGDISFRSSVDDLELEDDDMMYQLMQSEYEEIPSFRWIASPLRWWKTKRSRRRTHPRGNTSRASRRMEKAEWEADEDVESGLETVNRLVHIDGHPAYTIEELLQASAVVLGKGTYGTTYAATMEDGKQVAVKRLALGAKEITREEFETEVNVLGRIRHPNLLALRAYFFSEDEKLLVFDVMPVGSLSYVLHSPSKISLDWPTRMDIAIGTARGLHHLHTQENMAHGNLTSGNILLDDHASAHISDYSIPNIRTTATRPTRITTQALVYRAPEFSNLKDANTKTDVYSLGVILIEILTGKSPVEEMDGLDNLLEWVKRVTWTTERAGIGSAVDKVLLGDGGREDQLLNFLNLALSCLDPSPHDRPDVEQVLQQLEDIKQGIVGARGAATVKQEGTDIKISPPSSPRVIEERMAPLSEMAQLGASQTSDVLANEENRQDLTKITTPVSVSPTSSCIDVEEEHSTITPEGDIKEGENNTTVTPKDENFQDPSSGEELHVTFELGDGESTASMPSDQLKENDRAVSPKFVMDESFQARQPQLAGDDDFKKQVEEVPQTLAIESEHKFGENVNTEGVHHATSGGVLVNPPSIINWADFTLEARLDVPASTPLITSDPDLVYQRYFQALYDLANRSPPLPSSVLEVQLNRMVLGLHSLGYPLEPWVKAANHVLVSVEKREYIERRVGDYKARVGAQLAEFAPVVAPLKEEVSRTRSDVTALEQKQEGLREIVEKLEDQLAAAKEEEREVAVSLAIARDQLVEVEAKMEALSGDVDGLNQQYSAIPELRSAMLRELPSMDGAFDSQFREMMMTRKF